MALLLILGLATLLSHAQECSESSFSWINGTECWGLTQATSTESAAQCWQACCSMGAALCQTWQWCPVDGSCVTPGTCWVGLLGSDCQAESGWISAFRSGPQIVNLTHVFPLPPPVPVSPFGNNTSPDGDVITVDSVSFRFNGEPWLPVMGEFQYARTPAAEWADDLAKMRESGITVVASYIFWNYHEETQNVWNWSGQRNLTAFVQAVQAAGLKLFLRIGPWAHGECRWGGTPDWYDWNFMALSHLRALCILTLVSSHSIVLTSLMQGAVLPGHSDPLHTTSFP